MVNYDPGKIDDAALALLLLTLHDGNRAWKGLGWDVTDRLHRHGFLEDPKGKVQSVVFTKEGLARAEEMAEKLFKKE